MTQTGTIGIVGGGQLGRMLTEAALTLGFKVVVLNPEPNSPAAQAGANEIVGDLYDKQKLQSLADRSDYLTIEIEHLDADLLAEIAATGKSVHPSPKTLKVIQDKLQQKQFLKNNGLPTAGFAEITDEESAHQRLKDFGGKMVVKTRFGAYDGRGNYVVASPDELDKALKRFKDQPLYVESFVPFKKEMAIMIARDINGDYETYDPVETVHKNNICVEVIIDSSGERIKDDLMGDAVTLGWSVAECLEGAGVFGIEMFLTEDNKLLVNEIAPRVHNSGHHTIEACETSQFEQHIRAITGMPLGHTHMKEGVSAAVMINILGERDGPVQLLGVDEATAIPHTYVHIYGKSPTKKDRKMGHVTSLGKNVDETRSRAKQARELISI